MNFWNASGISNVVKQMFQKLLTLFFKHFQQNAAHRKPNVDFLNLISNGEFILQIISLINGEGEVNTQAIYGNTFSINKLC